MEESNNTNNIAFINYLKAFAIILVVTHHFNNVQNVFPEPLSLFVIYMAIPVFMTVTGFVYTNSYLRNNINDFKALYNFKIILKRILRVSIPFLLVFIVEYCFNLNGLHESKNIFLKFIQGGSGVNSGSYYYPVILQTIFIFPLIYFIIKKLKFKGFLILIFLEYIYSYICYKTALSSEEYRLQAFRYITLIASGTWLSLNREYVIKKKYLLLSLLAGIGFIYVSGIIKIPTQPYDYFYWKNASGIFITIYIFPIIYSLYKKFGNSTINNRYGRIFETIGKASWHIYLCQMVYYMSINNTLKNLNNFVHLFLNLLICIICGLLFYFLERKITEILKYKFLSK